MGEGPPNAKMEKTRCCGPQPSVTSSRGLFPKAVELEHAYAEDTIPRGVLGLNAAMFKSYLRFIANRRATQIGLEPLFPNEVNPFPWVSEMIDLKMEWNFLRRA